MPLEYARYYAVQGGSCAQAYPSPPNARAIARYTGARLEPGRDITRPGLVPVVPTPAGSSVGHESESRVLQTLILRL